MTKAIRFSAAAAALLVFPVLFCSCASSAKPEPKEEPQEIKQENNETPQAVEVKADANTEAELSAKTEKQPEKAVSEEKTEPAQKPSPAPIQETAKKVPPCEHTVRTGDNLWKIARQYYGIGSQWKLIYDANQGKIKKADFLEPGTVLTIPAAK